MNSGSAGIARVIGIMSGTSLDGLDIALCTFEPQGDKFIFSINKAITIAYSHEWLSRLQNAHRLDAMDYFKLNSEYGKFIGHKINEFVAGENKPALIASHGHTVFHQPSLGFTTQVGCGATISAVTGIDTVYDFRSLDVARGGQGAPLVPIGDAMLFGDYDACLNLGGIANVSFDEKPGVRVAYDICAANMLLNHLAQKVDKPFDSGGEMARSGKVDEKLLETLNNLAFFKTRGARSLGREWFEEQVVPLLNNKVPVVDLLATSVKHIATIIAGDINRLPIKSVLVTGGGAFNDFLIDELRSHIKTQLIVPDRQVVSFKEALVFAFLGYLRKNNLINTLSSVTGASSNSCSGIIVLASNTATQ